jgi:hypothetical protein
VELAGQVALAASFQVALIGEEVSGLAIDPASSLNGERAVSLLTLDGAAVTWHRPTAW